MNNYINNLNLCKVGISKINGFGVFAQEDIREGVIIEQIRPFIMSKKIFYLLLIFSYFFKFFNIKDSTNILKIFFYTKFDMWFLPSPMSYLNHSDSSNIGYSYQPKFGFTFFTIKNIKKGEELLLKYKNFSKNFK